jgi:pyridoxine/pyridoxamine 5'-phosphate oxidase
MQLLGDLDTLSFVRISQLNLTGRVNRMGSTRTASQVFNNNPRGSQLRGWPETRWNCIKKF